MTALTPVRRDRTNLPPPAPSKCHGENDDAFHFCQWCAAPSTYGSKDSDTALLSIDESAIEQRFAQFTKAVEGKPSTRRRDSASLLFERFLQSRVAGGPEHMVMAQPNDLVTFLCWLDSCSEKRCTAVHARDCEAVGISELSKPLNDGRGVYPTIRTRLLEDELRFQARHGLRTRPRGNTRLE